ncbi:DoxX family protein [Terriglobus albidus]|uniref:DoxX family protein n=1 Tax=Terriglobus albidus TaxID=1592106 RepID=UPI0021DFCF5E|nr:DoxX family protein [Terriglobus albidus]
MTKKTIVYWVSTVLVSLVLGVSGGMAVTHALPMMRGLAHLGYPPYFSNILGVGKIIGLGIFLFPGLPKLKEWAYAGFTITIVSACYSHFSSGDGLLALEPLATFGALMVSYASRPASRKIAQKPNIQTAT